MNQAEVELSCPSICILSRFLSLKLSQRYSLLKHDKHTLSGI
jgi:hypothetical protein